MLFPDIIHIDFDNQIKHMQSFIMQMQVVNILTNVLLDGQYSPGIICTNIIH